MTQGTKVVITNNYEYSRSFEGLVGVIVKTMPEGCNIFIPSVNAGGSYEDQIFWFPNECFTPSGVTLFIPDKN